jgi:hypothetical protein
MSSLLHSISRRIFGENRLKDIDCFLWLIKMISPPPCICPSSVPLFFQGLSSQKGQKGEEIVYQADEGTGLVGSIFKVCESYSESHLYLKEHIVK